MIVMKLRTVIENKLSLWSARTAVVFIGTALLLTAYCLLPTASSASDPGTNDWPMWGGTPDRNMVSNMKGLPTDWDVKTKKNVKWVACLLYTSPSPRDS